MGYTVFSQTPTRKQKMLQEAQDKLHPVPKISKYVIFSQNFVLSGVLLLEVAMDNLGCQLDYIWDQLKPKHLGMAVRDICHWII